MTVIRGYLSVIFGVRIRGPQAVRWAILPIFGMAAFQAIADTYTFQAITDFEDIAAGEIPYYVDDVAERNVLAINAAIDAYREKFARAVTVFDGDSGVYDVTITALGEIDGEGEFRFLVNGEVVGSAANELVTEDWGEQYHTFENISINMGDEIAVESDARSNGLIPENGEYAFARGRWRSVELVGDDAATANPVTVNLSVEIALQPQEVEPAELVAATITVLNLSSNVATNPNVSVTLPDNLVFVSGDGCADSNADNVFNCSMEEIDGSTVAVLGLALLANEAGSAEVSVQVSADQADNNAADNSTEAVVDIVAGAAGSTATEVATTVATEAAAEAATDAATDAAAEAVDSEAAANAVDNATEAASSAVNQAATSVTADVADAVAGESDEMESAEASGSSGGSGKPSVLLLLLAACLVRRYQSVARS